MRRKTVGKIITATPLDTRSKDEILARFVCTPFDVLLKGMDRQLIVNLNEERKITNRYPGLKVGSIDQPNNNAGNWE